MARRRNKLALDQAEANGSISAVKETALSDRVSSKLVTTARKKARLNSEAELFESSPGCLAPKDDFGSRLVRRKGTLPQDLDLAI
jgi:hypothetical protein